MQMRTHTMWMSARGAPLADIGSWCGQASLGSQSAQECSVEKVWGKVSGSLPRVGQVAKPWILLRPVASAMSLIRRGLRHDV